MEVSIIFKIAAVGILVSVLCQILKHSGREEQAFLVSLAGLLMVLLLSLLLHLPIHSFTAVLGAASLLGLIPGVLAGFGLVQILLPSLLCSGLSAIVLATMLLFRWQIVKGEVSRRFHL